MGKVDFTYFVVKIAFRLPLCRIDEVKVLEHEVPFPSTLGTVDTTYFEVNICFTSFMKLLSTKFYFENTL